jgi:SAM-dependent methyltransferase
MTDPRRVIADGYDRIHERYTAWSAVHGEQRRDHIDRVFDNELVMAGARALDLGCGSGGTVTAYMVQRGLDVTGVDISPESIGAARILLPGASFQVADMTELQLPLSTFRLVTAFYSIIHVPRADHLQLFGRIRGWLEPGGVFIASLGANAAEGFDDDWLGTRMYWSHWDAGTTASLLAEAGLEITSATVETEIEDGAEVSFLWVHARKES